MEFQFPTQEKAISTSLHRRKQDLAMKVERIILFLFIEMQVPMQMNIKGLKLWYLMTMESKLRWREM